MQKDSSRPSNYRKSKSSNNDSKLQRILLRATFSQFVRVAQQKLESLIGKALDQNTDISKLLDPGVDALFDIKTNTLATVAANCPKLIIDSLMIWRSSQAENNVDISKYSSEYPAMAFAEVQSRLRKRNALVSNFILVRVLNEIVKNLGVQDLDTGLGKKLEDMAFSQIRSPDPHQIQKHANLEANLRCFSVLLGNLSQFRFANISDRFIAELKVAGNDELKWLTILGCMRHIRLRVYPMEAIEDSADFLQALSEQLANSTSAKAITSLCDLIIHILEPVAKIATAEVNVPIWQISIEKLITIVTDLYSKYKLTSTFSALMTSLLAVSSKDAFLQSCTGFADSLVARFKDKTSRSHSLKSFCTLAWVNLFRCADTRASIIERRVDYFVNTFFATATDFDLFDGDSDLIVRVLYYCLVKLPDYTCDKIAGILGSETIDSKEGRYAELNFSTATAGQGNFQRNYDRLIVVVRSFMLFLKEMECYLTTSNSFAGVIEADPKSGIIVEGKIELSPPSYPEFETESDQSVEYLSKIGKEDLNTYLLESIHSKMGKSVIEATNLICNIVGNTFAFLFEEVGSLVYYSTKKQERPAEDTASWRRPSATVLDTFNTLTGIQSKVPVSNAENHPTTPTSKKLLRTIIDAIPRIIPAGLALLKLIEILSNLLYHTDDEIVQSSFQALCRLAAVDPESSKSEFWRLKSWNNTISGAIVQCTITFLNQHMNSNLVDIWASDRFDRYTELHSTICLSLLKIWVNDIKAKKSLDANEVKTILQKIEAQGIYRLLLFSPQQRAAAIEILKLATEIRTHYSALQRPKSHLNGNSDEKGSRLSSFVAGQQRASIFVKYSRRSNMIHESKTFEDRITVFEILQDHGYNLVKEYQYDPVVQPDENMASKNSTKLSQLLNLENPLLFVATSTEKSNKSIWYKCLPHLLKQIATFAETKTQIECFEQVWTSLRTFQPFIEKLSLKKIKGESASQHKRKESFNSNGSYEERLSNWPRSSIETLIECWRSLLSFAYTSINILFPNFDHFYTSNAPFRVFSQTDMNNQILPLISCECYEIRKAAVLAVGLVQPGGYAVMLNSLSLIMANVITHQPNDAESNFIKDTKIERMRTETTYLLSFLAPFVENVTFRQDKRIMDTILEFIKSMLKFFTQPEVEYEWKHQMTRYYFCAFIEKYLKTLCDELKYQDNEDINDYFPFEVRRQTFGLFECWSIFGVDSVFFQKRDQIMMEKSLSSIVDESERSRLIGKMKIHRKSIQVAASKSIAVLLRSRLNSGNTDIQFEIHRVVGWINSLLESNESKFRKIASLAIENVLTENQESESVFNDAVENCYSFSSSGYITVGYLNGLVDLLEKVDLDNFSLSARICLALYHMGSDTLILRKLANRLLVTIDKHLQVKESNLDSLVNSRNSELLKVDSMSASEFSAGFSIETWSITSSSPAVFKNARYKVSERLAGIKPELASEIISILSRRIKLLHYLKKMDKCKGLLNILGPWCRYIKLAGEFSLNPSEESPTDLSLICWTTINNLFYLTVTFNAIFQHEIEGIWKNVSRSCASNNTFNVLIDAFLLMQLKLGKPKLILFVRTILIYICRQGSGVALMNALARHLIPENLSVIDIDRLDMIFSSKCIPAKGYFLATIEDAGVESIFESSSVIHLCVEFLMDFMVEVEKVSIIEHLPILLTVCFLLMDSSHHECENMRRLLIVVVSSIFGLKQIDRSRIDSILIALEQRVSQTKQEGKLLWKREDSSSNPGILDSTSRMNALAFELLEILRDEYPNLRASWAVTALGWGVNMHIVHISCRALQLFRNLNSIPSFKLCLKLLNTLSKVAGSIDLDTQRYAFELICTASSFLELGVTSQNSVEFKTLFWTGIILLGSCNEWEYICGLNIVHKFCSMVSKNDDILTANILEVPRELQNCFDGALPLLVRGLSSSKAELLSLACINAALSESKFLFGSTDRFMFAVLSNLPRLMLKYPNFVEGDMKSLSDDEVLHATELLIRGAEKFGNNSLCKLLKLFSTDKIRSHDEFIANFVYIIIKEYPSHGWDAVRFCISLLSNRNYIYPKCFLEILDLILKDLIRIDLNVNQIDESWIGPLMGALDGRFHTKACSVLDSILSGRINRNETDITMVVGGAANMHTFVQKTLETTPSEHHENGTGWPFAGNNTSLVQTQLSMLLNTNYIDSQVHIATEKPATAGVSCDKAEALRLVFEDFDNFFTGEVAKLSPPA